MENEELDGVKFSEFPSQTPGNSDEVVGLHSGDNARFSVANFILAIRQGLANIFVPQTRTINGKALNNDISLSASDVGAVDTDDVGVADGVASLDSTGKVPGTQLNLSNTQNKITASGILKGDGQGGVSAATAGTDYQAPLTAGTDYATPGMIPTVPSISTTAPAMDGTAAAGSTGEVSDAGHVHPSDTSRVPVYGMGEQLLDNWYFLNPVNQRGATSASAASGYFIDRWTNYGSYRYTAAIQSGGILLTGQSNTISALYEEITDQIGGINGKKVTLSILTAEDGLCSASDTITLTGSVANKLIVYGNSSRALATLIGSTSVLGVIMRVPAGETATIKAVKLELGPQQTLAHLEGSTWVLNEIPDYEEELIKCQTSTADTSDTYANKSLATEQQLAYVETGTTASRAYAVEEYFCLAGLLYRVTSPISSGGTFTPGTNCEQVTGGGFNDLFGRKSNVITGTTGASSETVQAPTGAGRFFLVMATRGDTSVAFCLAYKYNNWQLTGTNTAGISINSSSGAITFLNYTNYKIIY